MGRTLALRCRWHSSLMLLSKSWKMNELLTRYRQHSNPCMKVLLHHFAARFFFLSLSLFVVTMLPAGSSNTHPAQPASAFKSVHWRRCTGWQTDSRGQYLGCCIEYIFGSSLPVTVETPSIQQRWGSTQLASPPPLASWMLPRRGRSWDAGG